MTRKLALVSLLGFALVATTTSSATAAQKVSGSVAITVSSVLPPGKANKQKTKAVASIQVAFNMPKTGNANTACSGRLSVGIATGSRITAGKLATSYTYRPARFSSGHWVGRVCAVWAFIPVSQELTGVRRSVRVMFRGNSVIKPFERVRKLLIWKPNATRPASAAAEKGPYSFGNWPFLDVGWGFVLPPNDRIVRATTIGTIPMNCPAPFGTVQYPANGLEFTTSHRLALGANSLNAVHKSSDGQNLVLEASFVHGPMGVDEPRSSFRLHGALAAPNPSSGNTEIIGDCSSDLTHLNHMNPPFDNGDKKRGAPR